MSIVSALTPDIPWRRQVLLSLESSSVMSFQHVLAAAGGLALLGAGWGMIHRRRRAATVAAAVLLALALVNIGKGLDYEESGVALSLALLLLASRRAFTRGGAPRAGVVAGAVAIAAVASAYALDTAALLASGRASSLAAALAGGAGALSRGAWWLRSGEPIAIALDLLLVLGLAAAAACLHALLRPAPAAAGHSREDHERAAAVVARWGEDSLDPFALREDKAFHFVHDGLLAYRTLRETAVVAGDPIGPPGTQAAILTDFIELADRRGWDVVVTGASERFIDDYRRLGLRALRIGDEAVVIPQRFSLEGRSIRKVRQSVNRMRRLGWGVEVVDGGALDPTLTAEIAAVEGEWRGASSRCLAGFAMTLGRLWGAPEDRDAVYALGRAPDGSLRAFVRFIHYGNSLSLDVMRRCGDPPNGLNEALIVATIAFARERGLAEVSLNFAGFAHVMAADACGLSRGQRLLRTVLRRFHGRFQLERLVCFNQKFEPDWRPRYLLYSARGRLPLAGLRVLQAETYIRAPRTRPLKQRWQPLPHPVEPAAALLAPPGPTR